MSVSWNKKYDPIQVINKIESARKIGSDGKVQFAGWGFQEYVTVIFSMLDFPEDIPEVDARGLVSKAMFNSGAKGEITTKSLISEVNKLEQKYESAPIEKYILATSISINTSSKLKRITFDNTSIVFESSLPAKFQQEINKLSKDTEEALFASLPTNYLSVKVHTSAKSIGHAANQALDTLDFTRGIWNWVLNMQHSIRMSIGGKPKPVNNIILGPLHTLHKPNGELAVKDLWWDEPSYSCAVLPFSFQHDGL